MDYVSLTKLYYKSPDSYESEYESRFNSPSARHIPISIKQFGHKKS